MKKEIEVDPSEKEAVGQASTPTTEQLEQELAAAKEQHLRLYAEFENFRKRTQKERSEWLQQANARLVLALLAVLDDFERALAADGGAAGGVQLIYDKLLRTLQQEGLATMEVAPGSAFDADLHAAIAEVVVDDAAQVGKVVEVTQKGYLLGEKVLRFAQVIIGKRSR